MAKIPVRMGSVQQSMLEVLSRHGRATARPITDVRCPTRQRLESSRHLAPPLSARLRAAVALRAASAVLLGLLGSAAAATSDRVEAGCPVAAASKAAAAAGARHRSALEKVAGLEKPVTYSETKIPLSELVQKVAADTSVPLT